MSRTPRSVTLLAGARGPASSRRACDHCRQRKIKCDSAPRCSNCRISERSCSYAVPARKRGPRFRSGTSLRGAPGVDQDISLSPNSTFSNPPAGTSPLQSFPTPSSFSIIDPAIPSGPQNGSGPPQNSRSIFDLRGIYSELASSLYVALPGESIEVLVQECIGLFVQYLFPIMPIVHEGSLRAAASLFRADVPSLYTGGSPAGWPTVSSQAILNIDDLSACRRLALITAVCAEAAFVLPLELFPKGVLIADHFLRASQRIQAGCQEVDIEAPDSSSIVIRYFHSNCTHAAGKLRLSWHLLGEAIRLAQEMSLYEENSLEGLDPIEAQLRRNVFWQLYTGDKSAALLNNRPFTLHEFNLRKKISLQHESRGGSSLLDHEQLYTSESYENHLMTSFHLCQRLWNAASSLLLDLQLLYPVFKATQQAPNPNEQQKAGIMDAYLQLLSLMDDMPPWLQQLDHKSSPDSDIERFQNLGFWIQRTNLEVTFHTLSLIIIQKFLDLELSNIVGISSEPVMVALKKTEIARGMLTTIQGVPFEALQANGESCVEKIRQIGAALLEITQTIDNEWIVTRAQSTFYALLDILASLDSRASASLNA